MIRKVAEREVEKLHLLEYGKVESVNIHGSEDDGIGYTCSVLLVGRTTDDGQMLKLENVPIVTGFTGQIDVPYVDDLVLVSYINGDFELPVIVGRLYSREKKPPLFEDGQHLIEIAPSRYHPNGPEQSKIDVKFTDGAQTTIHITNSSLQVTMGDTTMLLQSGGDPVVKIETKANVITMNEEDQIVIDGNEDVDIKALGDINIVAKGEVTIEGSKINLN
jgi:phage baseplate assembly protein gpV